MKKRLIISSIVSIFLSNEMLYAKNVGPTVQKLSQEVKELKNTITNYEKIQKNNIKDIEELYDYTEQTETRTLEDKLKFGLGYQVTMDNFSKKLANSKKVKNNNVIANKLMLNIKADITKTMKFHTRLSMYKYWGNGKIHQYSTYDNMQGRVPSVSTLFVERAYFDWFLNQDSYLPVAITIGRQPSADGPSHQLKNSTTRKATYSALLYDGASDGAMLTLDFSKMLSYKGTYLRFGYGKGYIYTESRVDASTAFVGTLDNKLKDTDVYGVFLDTKFPGVKQSLIQISYTKMLNIIANQLDTNTSSNTNIGDFSMYGIMAEFNNIKDTNLDLFAHYGYSEAISNGNSYGTYGGLLTTNKNEDSKTGYAVWLGARYSLDDKKYYKIGLEYNHGSKNWVSLTQGASDVYNKLATRGDAYEAYMIFTVNRYTNIRLGYIALDYEFTKSGWFVGESQKISKINTTDIDKLSSLYLKMSINY